jgi:hypothetical protein
MDSSMVTIGFFRTGSPERMKDGCAHRELRPYQPASLWHANRRSSRCTFLVGKHIGVQRLAVSASSSRRVHPSAGSSCRERIRFPLAKVWSRRSRRSSISVQGNRLAPARRRVADIDGVIPRPEESLPRTPVPAVLRKKSVNREFIVAKSQETHSCSSQHTRGILPTP